MKEINNPDVLFDKIKKEVLDELCCPHSYNSVMIEAMRLTFDKVIEMSSDKGQ